MEPDELADSLFRLLSQKRAPDDWMYAIWAANQWEEQHGFIDDTGRENLEKFREDPTLDTAIATQALANLRSKISIYLTMQITADELLARIDKTMGHFRNLGFNENYAGHEGSIRLLIWRACDTPWGVNLPRGALSREGRQLLAAYYFAFTDYAILGRDWTSTEKTSYDSLTSREQTGSKVNRTAHSPIRGSYPRCRDERGEYDFFISHASKDKDDFVRPLAEKLRSLGARVWYDEFTLSIGDSLRRSIDHGLARSRFGIVVLSPSFFEKDWTQYELDGLVTRDIDGPKVILPIWHAVTKEDVKRFSPTLADRLAYSTGKMKVDEIAQQLLVLLKGTANNHMESSDLLFPLRSASGRTRSSRQMPFGHCSTRALAG
jgi:hypothetical protein